MSQYSKVVQLSTKLTHNILSHFYRLSGSEAAKVYSIQNGVQKYPISRNQLNREVRDLYHGKSKTLNKDTEDFRKCQRGQLENGRVLGASS